MKNLTDFRKTVETGVDPRLTISTTKQVNLFLNSIYPRQRWVSTKLLKKGNIFFKMSVFGKRPRFICDMFFIIYIYFYAKRLDDKSLWVVLG